MIVSSFGYFLIETPAFFYLMNMLGFSQQLCYFIIISVFFIDYTVLLMLIICCFSFVFAIPLHFHH